MKFSIVVATYNRKEMLRRCVNSILDQSHKDYEIIVVDDGSTDGTDLLMREYSDERVKYIKLDKNYGTATPARNRGIEEMIGDALIIWDSDDVLLPNALETLQKGFDEHKDVGIVCTSTDFYKNKEKQKKSRIDSCLISPEEWFGGKKPKDAEIIAVKKSHIGNIRFETRGIDFMFYAKIIGKNMLQTYYINKTCGIVNLESDKLSLTLLRSKRNNKLSISRAALLDDFIQRYASLYIKGGANLKLSGHALGASVGYILAGNYLKARSLIKIALANKINLTNIILYLTLCIPGGGLLLKKFLQ